MCTLRGTWDASWAQTSGGPMPGGVLHDSNDGKDACYVYNWVSDSGTFLN